MRGDRAKLTDGAYLRRLNSIKIQTKRCTSDDSKTALRDVTAVRAPHPDIWRLWLSPIRTASALNAASARGERQILPRQTNSTAGFRGMSCDPPWSLSDTIFPTLAHSMGDTIQGPSASQAPALVAAYGARAA